VRIFIGTLLSAANQDVSDRLSARIVGACPGVVRRVPPRSAHITHAFLGEVDEALVNIGIADLREFLRSLAPVPFRLGRPEVLRAGREPRLVLAKLEEGGAEVSGITRRIVDRLRLQPALAGIAPARSPHVTLARFRRGAGSKDAIAVAGVIASSGAEAPWVEDRLDEVQWVRSELTPSGPLYEVLARAPAGGLA
jgi:2'-5' RNA ligase